MARESRQDRRQAAAGYASALYDLAVQQGRLDVVRDQIGALREMLTTTPALGQYLASPVVRSRDRAALVSKLAGSLDPLVAGVLTVMARRERLGLLDEVIDAVLAEDDRRNNRIPAVVTTAVEVDADLQGRISAALTRYLQADPIITWRVDPSILGGMIARAGDVLIDGSVRAQLADAMEHIVARGEDEIQSG